MIAEALRVIIGIPVALFIPGFLIVKLFFDEFNFLEKIAFSVVFSIMADISIAIFFGYDEAQALRTGGLTFKNIFAAEIALIGFLLIIFLIRFFIFKKNNIFNKAKNTSRDAARNREK